MVQPDTLDLQVQAVSDPARQDELHRIGAEQIRHGLFAWTFKSGRATIVDDTGLARPHAVAIVPLATPRSIIGACLILQDGGCGEFSIEQLAILSVLGGQFAAQTENHRLFRKLEEQNRTLETQVRKRTAELEATLRSLEKMNAAVLEAATLKNRFLANTSHELRTPLNSILGFLHLLKDGLYASPEEHAEFIASALHSGRHLLALINDLLDLAKIESGKMTVATERVSVARLFDDTRALMQVQARQTRLALAFECEDSDDLAVQADPQRLKQVLVNLIGNAIKFTTEGGVRVCAEPGRDDAGIVQFTVADTGIGIPEKTLVCLGAPFVQGDATQTGRFGGTGLGLAISRAFVEMMDGAIAVTSAGEGRGTTVSVWLPRSPRDVSRSCEPLEAAAARRRA
jgi:signal transduction histidine kinase